MYFTFCVSLLKHLFVRLTFTLLFNLYRHKSTKEIIQHLTFWVVRMWAWLVQPLPEYSTIISSFQNSGLCVCLLCNVCQEERSKGLLRRREITLERYYLSLNLCTHCILNHVCTEKFCPPQYLIHRLSTPLTLHGLLLILLKGKKEGWWHRVILKFWLPI